MGDTICVEIIFGKSKQIGRDIVIVNIFKNNINNAIELSTPQYNERQTHQEVG